MSIRRIMTRNKVVLKNKKQIQQIQNANIRTFLNKDSFELISQPSIQVEIIDHPNLKQEVKKLKRIAAYKKAVYLNNVQNEDFYKYFVIHKNPKQDLWFDESYSKPEDYQLYINGSIKKFLSQRQPVQEYCHSFPFIKSLVDRSFKILVKYSKIANQYEENKKVMLQDIQQQMTGFKSNIFQHCIDHNEGLNFFTPQVSKGRMSMQFNPQYFKDTSFLIRQYNLRIKNALNQGKQKSEQFSMVREDYVNRIRTKYLIEAGPAKQWSRNNKH